MIEFKWDAEDNRPKLIEVNGRFWGSLNLAIRAGWIFRSCFISSLWREG